MDEKRVKSEGKKVFGKIYQQVGIEPMLVLVLPKSILIRPPWE